ncbi:MAG: phenylalanine--tRNA ligase beta subunit-related protein [Pseudomonadota bacterium]
MSSLEFRIDGAVINRFPDLRVFGLRVHAADPAAIAARLPGLQAQVTAASEKLADVEPITALEAVSRWRTAYGSLGVKPSKFPSSIEALLRRARKGQAAATGIPLVDLYNALSILNRVPMGAYDVSKLDAAPIVLREADVEDDTFTPLGGSSDSFPLNPALVVHAQGNRILCWGFNTRDSAHSAVDEGSAHVVFFSEATDAGAAEDSRAALETLAELVQKAGGTSGAVVCLGAEAPSATLPAPT